MDDSAEIIKNFEEICKRNDQETKLSLYSNKNKSIQQHMQPQYNPQAIISNISLQLKAIQKADTVTNSNDVRKSLDKYKKLSFLPVDMLPKDDGDPPKSIVNKFETQFEIDTQLMNIIENGAELVDTNNGITQEFENTFHECDIKKKSKIIFDGNANLRVNSKSKEHNDENIFLNEEAKVFEESKLESTISENKSEAKIHIENHIQLEDNCTEELKNCFDESAKSFLDNIPKDEDIPCSYVFQSFKRSNTPLPLVFDLNTFEDFEKIANPIIGEHADIKSAKHLINSQIVGRQLLIQSDNAPQFSSLDIQLSPVLEKTTNKLKVTKNTDVNVSINANSCDDHSSLRDVMKDSVFLKDEIIFSSDEENEYIYKQAQDLPLTCALETSFYNQSQVLDKTIYVGFQTASNKSIQVCTESYTRAKSFLVDLDDDENKVMLSELVDMYDNKKNKNNSIHKNINFMSQKLTCHDDENNAEGDFNHNDCLQNESKITQTSTDTDNQIMTPIKRKFEGFTTADNKKIKLSEHAKERCKQVLQNIDLEDNIALGEVLSKESERFVNHKENEMTSTVDTHHIDDDILNEFAQDMPLIDKNQEIISKTDCKKTVHILGAAIANNNKILDHLKPEKVIGNKVATVKDNEDKHSNLHDVVGFKTASNKNIKVTEEALAKSKRILEVSSDIEINDDEDFQDKCLNWDQPSTSKLHVCGFKTASNKEIQISVDALAKSKPFFKDIIDTDSGFNGKTDGDSDISNVNQLRSDVYGGFKTANNKKIEISKAAYLKTKNMFKNIMTCEDEVVKGDKESKIDNKYRDTQLELELQEVNKFQHEIYDDFSKAFENAPFLPQEKVTPKFCGFKTASNKEVNVSEKAIIKSKMLFADLDSHIDLNIDSEKQSANLTTKSKVVNNANCKRDTAVTKSKICSNKDTVNNFAFGRNTEEFIGFKTASNKAVKISEKALAQSKKLFSDIEIVDFDIVNEKEFDLEHSVQSVDKDLLNNSQDKFSNIHENKKEIYSPKLQPFQTAVKETTEVFNKTTEKCSTIFKDIQSNTPELRTLESFKTASKKPIQITAQAMMKSMALFKDIDSDNFDQRPGKLDMETKLLQANKNISFKGFETGSRKSVPISVEALPKGKALFKKSDTNNSSIPNLGNKPKSTPLVTINQTLANKKLSYTGSKTGRQKRNEVEETQDKSLAIKESSSVDLPTNNELYLKNRDCRLSDQIVETTSNFENINNNAVFSEDDALTKGEKLPEDTSKRNIECMGGKYIGFNGFQTASKKKVLISEQALKNSRLLFQDNESPEITDKLESNDGENKNKENHNTNILKAPFSFKSASNNIVNISQDALNKSKKLFTDTNREIKYIEHDKGLTKKPENNLERVLDNQVIDNFEGKLCTESFRKNTTPRQSKRSGSPILSCPKAKRRKKFETPYRTEITSERKIIPKIESKIDPINKSAVSFNENYKKTKRYTLKDLAVVEKNSENIKTHLNSYLSGYDFDTLLNFQFTGKRNNVTDFNMSIEDVKDSFQNAVNKKMIPDRWLNNHIKLVIWKLLSYEVKFPNTLCGVCNVRNVLDQLKYRYDRELYNAERPALRKILEKDDVASKTLVLCVAAIFVDGHSASSVISDSSNVELLLTDGWYCIKATIDKMLTKLVSNERITIGCKIITNGAELVNCEQGVAPWEDTSSVRLKIFGNSTRRARWDARLGYHGNAAILTPLSSVKVEGGKVSKLRLYVTRVYPALFVERFEDGSTVTRSERLETIHQLKYESERQIAMEKLYEEIEKELSDQESQDSESSYSKRKRLYDSSQDLCRSDPRSFEERSNKRRERIIQNIQLKLQEKMAKNDLTVNRNVISLLKVRVAGFNKNNEVTKGLMSIWKPNEAITEIIREGIWIEVLNVVPTGIRYSEIQISAGRHSIFRETKYKENDKMLPYTKTLKRKCYHIKELAKNPTLSTDYNEIDTVGFIFLIDPPMLDFESSKQAFQNVYLTDAERNIICVNFWGGLKKFGYHNILDTGQVVACVNLQKRTGNTKKSIPHYRVTEFSYFTKTPKNVDARNYIEELIKNLSGLDKRKYCNECIVLKNNFNKSINFNNENISPYRINNVHNLTKNKIFIDSPLANKPVDENLNLTGLDFESTFKQDTQELSPSALLRKKKVNEKIAKLRMYGEPPPLSPIHIINKSKSAFNSYKSPLALNDKVTRIEKVTENSRKEDSNIQTSPILAMNRTYVKNVNPVKLNFSNVQNDTTEDEVDHFAEDFDASPPLSLD